VHLSGKLEEFKNELERRHAIIMLFFFSKDVDDVNDGERWL